MKRISNYDRLMIMKHTPDFREWLVEFTENFDPENSAKFSEAWNLEPGLLSMYRNLIEEADTLKQEKDFVEFKDKVNSLPLFRSTLQSKPVTVKRYRRNRYTHLTEGTLDGVEKITIQRADDDSDALHLRARRFLTVELDLFSGKKELLEATATHIDYYCDIIEKRRTRESPFTIDPWAAYHMHVVKGRPLHQIAAELIESAPKLYTGEDPMGAAEQAIHRAADQARHLLKKHNL